MAVTNLTIAALASSLFQDTVNGNAAIVVKASSGTLYVVNVDNSANAAIEYVKLWALASAVTVGTTAPDWVLLVPASYVGTILLAPAGLAFANGLQAATVTTAGTAGTTSPSSALILRIAYT